MIMAGYSIFAQFYDQLTQNADYANRAQYLLELMHKFNHSPGLTLDLACGTGSLTLELHRLGIDVYGVDSSVEMLSLAQEKCMDAGVDILFLHQKMQDLNLFGTVDTILCTLDSINHLQGKDDVLKTFEKVHLFLNPGGYFIFDINTLYKHNCVLGNNTFVYDLSGLFCVWQNRCKSGTGRVDINLDFFQRDGKFYRRSTEHFTEYAYPNEMVIRWLRDVGFAHISVFDELTFQPPKEHSQRLVFVAKKKEEEF